MHDVSEIPTMSLSDLDSSLWLGLVHTRKCWGRVSVSGTGPGSLRTSGSETVPMIPLQSLSSSTGDSLPILRKSGLLPWLTDVLPPAAWGLGPIKWT
jgi:hypothetical protein